MIIIGIMQLYWWFTIVIDKSMKEFFIRFGRVFKRSLLKFIDDNAIKLSASLSYYTIFAIPPMLIIIFAITGFFFGKDAIQGSIFYQISGLVGPQAAAQIQDAIKNIHLSGSGTVATVISVITLLIAATGLFAEIQDSINFIWGIKAKPKRGWLKVIANRLLSFSMIVTMGFLFLVSLIINTVMDLVFDRLAQRFTHLTVGLVYIMNILLVFTVITLLFQIIFKVLPDGRVNWRDSLTGSAFTAALFMIGKFMIGIYLGHSAMTGIYGAAGSVVLILLWVYYSSIILYFGAEFTMIYACMYGKKIVPNDYAVFVETKEIEHRKSDFRYS